MTHPGHSERGARVHFPPPLVFVGFALLGIALRYAVAPLSLPIDRRMSLAVLPEERYLTERFGDDYRGRQAPGDRPTMSVGNQPTSRPPRYDLTPSLTVWRSSSASGLP